MASSDTTKSGLQVLVGPLRLAVGLGMIPRRKAGLRSQGPAEGTPNR